MHIFLTGCTGFIGSHFLKALIAKGHSITCAVRAMPQLPEHQVRYVIADFSKYVRPEQWIPHLEGMDVVINTVGIIREHGQQTFETLHTLAPIALFEASKRHGVGLILQLSALGADEGASSRYHLSKKAADDFLQQQGLPAMILQPSLVYGAGGKSASLFNTLASMPLLTKFGHGRQWVQPVHIDDLVDAMIKVLHRPPARFEKIAIVGPSAITLIEFLKTLRQMMQLPPALIITIPLPVARFAASILGKFKSAPLDREMFQMLERGNTADAGTVTTLLGRSPRRISLFLQLEEIAATRRTAQLNWLLPVLRFSIALVWIATGIISFGVYPVSDSYALLARAGISDAFAPVMLYGAAAFDLALGIAILFIHNKWIWRIQISLIIFYTAIIAWKLPEFVTHPYGPLLKNLPMLAAIWLLHEWEEA